MGKKEGSNKKNKRGIISLIIFFILILLIYSFYLFLLFRVRVIDGDTLVFLGKRIRVYGIDCPEMGKQKTYFINYMEKYIGKVNISCLKYYAILSKQLLENFTKSYKIRIKPIKLDKYKRILSYVYFCKEKCIDYGLYVVRNGYCIVFPYEKVSNIYYEYQRKAIKNKIGIWGCSISKV